MKQRTIWLFIAVICLLTMLWGFGMHSNFTVLIIWLVCWGIAAIVFFVLAGNTAADKRIGGASSPVKNVNLLPDNYCAIDVITHSPDSDELIELAAIRVRSGKPVGQMETLVAQSGPLPQDVAARTGLTDAALAGQPSVKQAIEQFLSFVGNDTFIAPNVGRMQTELFLAERASGVPMHRNILIDPLMLEQQMYPGDDTSSINALMNRAGLMEAPATRALTACKQTVACYRWLRQTIINSRKQA
ncbi:3'-5' exonuclease [Bifidobacterium gallicum]|nr:3'-5' exonuclease [Bifidobacterium gallicum]KFI59429.1 exonuclease family protein [Bifidobacterium gallicum DSM 20093 = LMG 11596]